MPCCQTTSTEHVPFLYMDEFSTLTISSVQLTRACGPGNPQLPAEDWSLTPPTPSQGAPIPGSPHPIPGSPPTPSPSSAHEIPIEWTWLQHSGNYPKIPRISRIPISKIPRIKKEFAGNSESSNQEFWKICQFWENYRNFATLNVKVLACSFVLAHSLHSKIDYGYFLVIS